MRQREELLQILKDQIDLLNTSCHLYDSGKIHHALPMANLIRMFIKSKGQTISLLDQLDVSGLWYDTRSMLREDAEFYAPLIRTVISGHVISGNQLIRSGRNEYTALLASGRPKSDWPKIEFTLWWNQSVLKSAEKILSRADVILTVAEKDGGTHLDPKLNPTYSELKAKNSIRSSSLICGERVEIDNSPIYPTVRQIAFETVMSLEELLTDQL